MSRGRKSKSKNILQSWQEIYSKNVGYYFRKIIFELGKNNKHGVQSAFELLEQIKIEKEKSGKKEKPLPIIKHGEFPFKIPDNWVWCRLGEMSVNLDGARKPIALSERENREKIYDYYGASGVIDKIDGYTHEGELLLIGEDGANLISRSTPIAYLAKGKFWVNNHAHVLDTIHRITLDYLCGYINSIDLKPFVTGGFQPKLSQGNLNLIPVPLPPLVEQEKIISFLNDFEKENLRQGHSYFDKKVEQEISHMHQAQIIGSELKMELADQLTQIELLNQSILQEAVQGKLVKQNPADESARELLKRIKAEKAKSGKKEKPLPPIKPDEIPFKIPENWVWCRLGDAVDLRRGKSKYRPRNDNRLFTDGKYPFIQTGDVSKAKYNDDLITTINGYYNEFGLAQSALQPKGTLCITIAANIAECGFLDFNACVPDSIVCLEAIDKCIENFVYHYLKLAKADLERFAPATAQKNINLEILNELLIPLPPLSEQIRIVTEIEKQLAKTKQLKKHIIANQNATEQLLKALLHGAFEPRLAGEVETLE